MAAQDLDTDDGLHGAEQAPLAPPAPPAPAARRSFNPLGAVGNAALLAGSLLMIFPFVWMILGSLRPAAELSRPAPSLLPESPSLDNFVALFTARPFERYFLNSLFVTGVTVALILFTSSLLGYIFARGTFVGAKAAFIVIISAMIVPFEVLVVPLFLIVDNLGWQDTYLALIVPYVVDAFGIYLFREFVLGIPKDYFDAAKVDGASEWMIYRSIAMPLCKPVFASLAIFSFVYIWDQLIWPVVVISSDARKTLPLGIALLSTESGARFDLVLAAGVLAVLPPLAVFLIFQRRIVRGVIMAGLKG